MSFTRSLLCTLLLWVGHLSVAQSVEFEGRVVSTQGAEPVFAAVVAFGEVRTTTDDLGLFRVQVPVGRQPLLVRAMGFGEWRDTVDVQPDRKGYVVILTPANSELDMVVVSAGKFDQRVGEVTQSLSVLRPELVRNKNIVALNDALDQVPGVVVVDNDPQIRAGSGFSYGAGSRVMMLVDDLPILSGDIGRPSWTFLPIENLEQVEVIKGASSVLYGSAALSGVINVRTAYPRATPRTRATVFGGFYDTPGHAPAKWWGDNPPAFTGANFFHAQQFGAFDLVIGGNAFTDAGYVGPERIRADSLEQDPYHNRPSAYENRVRFNVATRWRNKKVHGLNYGVNANAMKSRSISVLLWDDTDEGLFRPEPGTSTSTRGTQYYIDPFVNYHSAAGTRHTLRGRLYRQDFENNNAQSNSNDLYYGEYQVQQKVDWRGPLVVTAGVTLQRTFSKALLYSGDPDGDGVNAALDRSAYLQVDKQFLDKLSISAGARYSSFQVNTVEQSTPVFRAGATYRLLKATYVRASYGQGFRFPTIGERYIRTAVGLLNIYPNEDLRAERSYNMEAGVKQGFTFGRFKGYLDAVVFQQEFEDYVEFTFGVWANGNVSNLFGLGFRSVNTGGARITGGEAELTATGDVGAVHLDLMMGYTTTLPVSTTPHQVYATDNSSLLNEAYTYSNTSYDTTDNILKFRVQHLFRADAQAKYHRLSIGGSVRYNSHVRNIDRIFVQLDEGAPPLQLATGVSEWMRTHTSGDWIVDARLGFDLTTQVKAAFIVNNLGNAVYAIRPMAIEAPRSWQVQLALEL
ncbi:MAG TPA: TonB-dependent receptor [Flavobacteriales bacterium]